MELRGILADMDDTVLVHQILADDLWRETVEALCTSPTLPTESIATAIIVSRHQFWADPRTATLGRLDVNKARRTFVTTALDSLGLADDALTEALVSQFSRERDRRIELEPETELCLKAFRSAGIRMSLVTNGNGRYQREKVERFGLQELFDSVVIEGEYGIGKPDWRIYTYALETIDVPKDQAVMVGDNWDWEIAAPGNHGLPTVWIHRVGDLSHPTPPPRFLGAIRTFSEFPAVLECLT